MSSEAEAALEAGVAPTKRASWTRRSRAEARRRIDPLAYRLHFLWPALRKKGQVYEAISELETAGGSIPSLSRHEKNCNFVSRRLSQQGSETGSALCPRAGRATRCPSSTTC